MDHSIEKQTVNNLIFPNMMDQGSKRPKTTTAEKD